MLFFTKVGRYTEEEFETAFGQFKTTNKPFIFTYFKDAAASNSASEGDKASLLTFQKKLSSLEHFYTRYQNIEGLKFHFTQQLDKLVAGGFIEFRSEESAMTMTPGVPFQAPPPAADHWRDPPSWHRSSAICWTVADSCC